MLVAAAYNPYPMSHILAKSSGQNISIGWSVRNVGGLPGQALLRLLNQSMNKAIGVTSPVDVTPGSTVPLSLDIVGLTEGQAVQAGTNQMVLEMIDFTVDPINIVRFHGFTVNFTPPPPSFLQVLSQTLVATDVDVFEWRVSVRNNSGADTGFFIPRRTETNDRHGGPFIRDMSFRTVLPGMTLSPFSTTQSSVITHLWGEMWVDEVNSSGSFIRELPPRVAYDIFI